MLQHMRHHTVATRTKEPVDIAERMVVSFRELLSQDAAGPVEPLSLIHI